MGLLKERLKKKISKLKVKQSLLLSTNLFILMLPLALTPASTQDISRAASTGEIKLALDKHIVVESVSTLPTIQPGESIEQKITREKAEADAKAKADADSRTKAKAEAARIAAEKAAQAQRNVVARESQTRVVADPSNFDEIYAAAGAAYGVDPRILKAVHTVETGRSGSTAVTSYANAQGPMQFLPSTWRSYGVDGNGDGRADITNVSDAIFAAAKYLKACGYPDVKKALWGYNPSQAYYNKVMNVAHSFGF